MQKPGARLFLSLFFQGFCGLQEAARLATRNCRAPSEDVWASRANANSLRHQELPLKSVSTHYTDQSVQMCFQVHSLSGSKALTSGVNSPHLRLDRIRRGDALSECRNRILFLVWRFALSGAGRFGLCIGCHFRSGFARSRGLNSKRFRGSSDMSTKVHVGSQGLGFLAGTGLGSLDSDRCQEIDARHCSPSASRPHNHAQRAIASRTSCHSAISDSKTMNRQHFLSRMCSDAPLDAIPFPTSRTPLFTGCLQGS